jgi:hypothetical protein
VLGVYVPSVALIAAAAIFRIGLLPWAASIAAFLGLFAFSTTGEFFEIVN